MAGIIYRKAEPDEMETIMTLVVRTFTGEQEIPFELNFIPKEKEPQWFCAEEDNQIIGVIAFFREKDGWHGGRFALEPACRNRHIGTELVIHAFQKMFDSGVHEIMMEGRPATVHILTKLGAEVTGEEFPFYKSTCTPMRMARESFQTNRKEKTCFAAGTEKDYKEDNKE